MSRNDSRGKKNLYLQNEHIGVLPTVSNLCPRTLGGKKYYFPLTCEKTEEQKGNLAKSTQSVNDVIFLAACFRVLPVGALDSALYPLH